MSDTDLPLVPVDPRETGPIDVVASIRSSIGSFVSDNAPWVIVSITSIALGVWYLDVAIPSLPSWVVVGLGASAFAAPFAALTGFKLARALYSRETVLLSIQSAESGDQKLLHIAPERFADIEVRTHNDVERERSYLHEVTINGRRAYEVDRYDPEDNLAVASWQAGVSNSEIRRDRKQIERIKTDLEEEADKAMELLANHPDILREQTREVADEIIRVAEGVEVPSGEGLHETLSETLAQNDPSEDLLSEDSTSDADADHVEQDERVDLDGDDVESVVERAANGGGAILFGEEDDE
jgi:hypothetical protein